jgi:hypothetical protein
MTIQAHRIRHTRPADQRVQDGLHPFVYRSIIALTIWLVLSVWAFFNRGAYVGLTLAVVTVFFLIAVAISVLIWMTWQHNAPPEETRTPAESFDAWASQGFATSTGTLGGREAATQILLPIAAVAIGMTIFGLVYYFDVPHLG